METIYDNSIRKWFNQLFVWFDTNLFKYSSEFLHENVIINIVCVR